MKKRDWFLVLALVPLIWSIDALTKMWALQSITGFTYYGPLALVLHRNPGAMLGMFSDLPPVLRIVSLSTGGAFLVFLYMAIQYLVPKRVLSLRIGMSLLLGGILGNVTDRIIWGSVVDFLVIGRPPYSTAAFNFADAIQWVGYILIVIAVIKEGNRFWPEANIRKTVWVNRHFQLKYIFVLIAIGLGYSIVAGVFSFTYIKVIIDDFIIGDAAPVERRFLKPFFAIFSVISASFVIVLFVIGKILSHRTAGPLYAFELYLDDLLAGRNRKLRLRAGDEFQHLEELADRMHQKFFPPTEKDGSSGAEASPPASVRSQLYRS